MDAWFKENAVNLIGHGLTIVGIIVGVAIVFWQLARQQRSSLLLQRESAKEQLKLQLHERLVRNIRRVSHANVRAMMYAKMIPFNVDFYQQRLARGLSPAPIEERVPEFVRLHEDADKALIELLEEFEAWSIAFPGLGVFKVALNAANQNIRESFVPLFTALMKALPIDRREGDPVGHGGPLVQELLTVDELAALKLLAERYAEAMDEVGSYIYDLNIESQNNLLSALFERRVPQRQPIDDTLIVISTDEANRQKLLHYFEHETSWGKARRAAETDARVKCAKP